MLAVALATGLAACGSRDDGDPTSTGGATLDANGNPTNGPDLGAAAPEPVTIEMFSDAVDLETGGTEVVTITATLIDERRVPMAGAPVQWSASGGVLQNVAEIADENGLATAVLRMPQDFRNRRIEVQASSGDSSQQIAITAYGTVLDVQGGERSVVIGNEMELVVTLSAGNGEPIINQALVLTAANGNDITPAEPITDVNGRATLRIGTELGGDSVTIEALDDPSLTRTIDVDVSTDQLSFSTPDGSNEFGVKQIGTVDILWTSGGEPVVGGELRVTTSAGQLLSDVSPTDASGRVSLSVASASAGPAQIRVQDAADGDPSGTFDVEFVATTPRLVNLSTTSSRVFVNGTSDISVLVRDADGNPVKNREVEFGSGELFGGQINPSTAITDSEGRARSGFTAGGNATSSGAISIFATVPGATDADGRPLSSARLGLSVVERRLNVTLGAGNGLASIGLDTQYAANLVVQVADGSGIPLPEADVSLSITPIEYYKGALVPVDEGGAPRPESAEAGQDWQAARWDAVPQSIGICKAEDDNQNRILDVEQGEDRNGNQMLDPQDPAVLTAVEDAASFATLAANGTLVTDANGTGYFRLSYPKANAQWTRLLITARVNALGSEGQDSIEMPMAALAGDLADIGISPPNQVSPYGVNPDCSVPD